MDARTLRLTFDVCYVECDLANKIDESHPILEMYFGEQFVPSKSDTPNIATLVLDEDHLQNHYQGVLQAALDPALRDGGAVPAAAGIGLASCAVHRNDFGHPCYVNVGTSHILLQDIFREVRERGYYDHRHDLIMHTTVAAGVQPVKKGVVDVRFSRVELGAALSAKPLHPAALQSAAEVVTQTLAAYVQSTILLEQSIPDTLHNTERIRAPLDISEVGIESTRDTFLPVAAFAMLQTPRANPAFFRNALDRVMARRGLNTGAWHDFDEKEKCRTLGLMLTYGVQNYCDYIGDAVELTNRRAAQQQQQQRRHVGSEEFSNVYNTMAGDCEDSANGIATTMRAFRNVQFDPTAPSHAALIDLQRIAADYVPLMTLAVVHGAKIGDQEGFGAHMYLPLMPRHQWDAGLAKTARGRQLLQRMQPAVAPVAANSTQPKSWEQLNEERPFLFCEGTGRIDPLGYTDPIYAQRKYLAERMPSLGGFKKEIPHEERGPSPFYYASLFGVSDSIMEESGISVGGFVLGNVNTQHDASNPSQAHEMTRGVLFTDSLAGTNTLAIMPQPPMPPAVLAIVKEALAFRPPHRALILDERAPLEGPAADPLLDRFVQAIKALKRPAPQRKPPAAVDMFVRPHQYNEAVINQMIREATTQAPLLYDISYEKENLMNKVYGYRVQLWIAAPPP